MNPRKWLSATVVGFFVITISDFLIHHKWLMATYMANPQYWRVPEEMKARMPFLFLGELISAMLLALIYPKGYQRKSPATEGVRFGLLMGFLVYLPQNMINYFIYPFPTKLFVAWTLGGIAEYTLAGIFIGLVYGKNPA